MNDDTPDLIWIFYGHSSERVCVCVDGDLPKINLTFF